MSGYVSPDSLLGGQQCHGLFSASLGEEWKWQILIRKKIIHEAAASAGCYWIMHIVVLHAIKRKWNNKTRHSFSGTQGLGCASQNQSSCTLCRVLHFTASKYCRFSWQEWSGKGPNAEQKSYSQFAVLLHHWLAMWSLAISLILSVKWGKPEPMSPKTK